MSISINLIDEIIKKIEEKYPSQFNCSNCGLCCLIKKEKKNKN